MSKLCTMIAALQQSSDKQTVSPTNKPAEWDVGSAVYIVFKLKICKIGVRSHPRSERWKVEGCRESILDRKQFEGASQCVLDRCITVEAQR